MHFSKNILGSAIVAAAFAIPAFGAMTSQAVVDAINGITDLSQKLQGPASSINALSGSLFVIGQGPFPQVITGFQGIISQAAEDINAMDPKQPPFTVATEEEAIVSALTTFVEVHQALLNILIGKAGLLQDLPFVGAPVAAVLRSLESVVDSIAFDIIRLIPNEADSANAKTTSLDGTLSQAIQAYTPVA